MDKVLLIDGHNLMWRACVSFGPPVAHLRCQGQWCEHTRNTEVIHCQCGSPWDESEQFCYGEKYGYVFNYFRNLRPLIEQFSPEKCFFVLEGRPQFRYDLFSEYKANRLIKQASRQEANEKFLQAREMILPLMERLPITTVKAAKYEADDVVATLAINMSEEEVTILSGDTDYIQLLQKGLSHLRVYNPIKKTFMEAPPYPYLAWKCLAGDKSDNIPSLLGPKTALKTIADPALFQKFLEVEENRANFSINRQLIEFRSVPEEEIEWIEGERDFSLLKDAFTMMKFESIVNDYAWERYVKTFDCIRY
jgi:5'-3' exonuclease